MVMNILRSKKFAKRVLLALLVLIIPAFVLWGAGSIAKRPPLVGRIGGQKISIDTLAKSVRGVKVQLLLAYYNDPNTMNRILQNSSLVNHMAWERLVLLNAALRERVKVTDKDVLGFISQHPLFQKNGVFDMQIYNYMLRNVLSMDPPRFERLIRENLQVSKFRQSLFKDISITEDEIFQTYKAANDKVDLSYVMVDKNLFRDKAKVHPEEVKKYYAENREDFASLVKVDIEYIEIPYKDLPPGDAGMEQLRDLHAKLGKAPENFRETADKNNLRYGRTGIFSSEELIPGMKYTKKLHAIAFSIKEGQISQPIFSDPGDGVIYILHKARHLPSVPLELEEVREKIEVILADDKCTKMAGEKADGLYEKITKTNMRLEEAAMAAGQEVKKIAEIKTDGYIQNIGPARSIVARALETEENKVIPPILVREKGVLLVRVDKITPADESGFEEKKNKIRQNILTLKQINIMDKWFKENASNVQLNRPLEEL